MTPASPRPTPSFKQVNRFAETLRIAVGLSFLCALFCGSSFCLATSNYEYGPFEYVTIAKGISPDKLYAITAHGEGELGDENFHLFLTNAVTGKKIGTLEEIKEFLDTGAGAFCARWSADSQQALIVYRVDRHAPLKAISYHIFKGRATLIKGPVDANEEQSRYWSEQCSNSRPTEKTFGTPKGR